MLYDGDHAADGVGKTREDFMTDMNDFDFTVDDFISKLRSLTWPHGKDPSVVPLSYEEYVSLIMNHPFVYKHDFKDVRILGYPISITDADPNDIIHPKDFNRATIKRYKALMGVDNTEKK